MYAYNWNHDKRPIICQQIVDIFGDFCLFERFTQIIIQISYHINMLVGVNELWTIFAFRNDTFPRDAPGNAKVYSAQRTWLEILKSIPWADKKLMQPYGVQ